MNLSFQVTVDVPLDGDIDQEVLLSFWLGNFIILKQRFTHWRTTYGTVADCRQISPVLNLL